MGELIQVGMAEIKLAAPPDKLMTAGLGSCIGMCLFEPQLRIASMSHIMLPQSPAGGAAGNPGKYADTAIIAALAAMKKVGVVPQRLVAKIAGGAQMFLYAGSNSDIFNIGGRNSIAVRKSLTEHRIKLLGEDVGGNSGRTVIFDPATGDLLVRTINQGEKVI